MKPRRLSSLDLVGLYVFVALSSADNPPPPSHEINTEDYCRSVGKALGRCIPLQDCALFSGWLKQRPILKQNVKTVVRYTCYFDLEKPKVCCPLSEIDGKDAAASYNLIRDHSGISQSKINPNQRHPHPPRERLVFPEDAEEPAFSKGRNIEIRRDLGSGLSLLPSLDECGSGIKLSRIVGTFGAYPWIALLGNKDSTTGNWTHICSGTLISNKYVLTSAHCFTKNLIVTHIRLGEYDLLTKVDRGSPFLSSTVFQEFTLEKAIIHPDYDDDDLSGRGDIALVRIQKTVSYSAYVRPICLPLLDHYDISQHFGTEEEETFVRGNKLLVAGWGQLYLNSTGYRTLQEAQIRITSSDECSEFHEYFSNSKQYCVGGNYRLNVCLTDDGGGLLMPMRLGSTKGRGPTAKVFQVGVFSSGPSEIQCQRSDGTDHRLVFLRNNNRVRSALAENVPAVYTKVYPYLGWILEQLKP